MKCINQIVANHEEWVKIVNSFGEYFFAEDIVQETYLMLLKWSSDEKLVNNGKLNKAYIWLALKNTFLQHVRKENKITFCSLDTAVNLPAENTNEKKHEAENIIDEQIKNAIKNLDWYDKMLFDIYKNQNLSMRKISLETHISVTSIFYTIQRCKQKIKFDVMENYQDFKNEEYELIN